MTGITHNEFRKKLKLSPDAAHRELFEEYCSYVYTIVFSRLKNCGSREDIEECVCDVFADVFVYYDSEKELDGDVTGFIGTIARRKSGEFYRKSTGRPENISMDEISEYIQSDTDTENEAEKRVMRRTVLEKITELGEPDSTLIIQKYYYGRKAAETAEMLSMTAENVRVRTGRAVKKLRKILEKSGISL